MIKQQYRLTVNHQDNYVSVEALYYGPADVDQVILHRYSSAIDLVVDRLFGMAYTIECLSRKTVSDVRSHEYKLTAVLFENKGKGK